MISFPKHRLTVPCVISCMTHSHRDTEVLPNDTPILTLHINFIHDYHIQTGSRRRYVGRQAGRRGALTNHRRCDVGLTTRRKRRPTVTYCTLCVPVTCL